MSSICGIIDFESEGLSFGRLAAMGRAMALRGKEQSGAYINRGVGIEHNRMILSGTAADRQPYTIEKDGRAYTIAFDGEIYNREEISKRLGLSEAVCSARAVLEYYASCGIEAIGALSGAFAFVIYDEYKREVILARDRLGSKPLYYMADGRRLIFASAIKGLLAYGSDCFEVSRDAMIELYTSDIGTLGGADVYRDIDELPAGCFGVYSRLGFQISSYQRGEISACGESREGAFKVLPTLSEHSLETTLCESLFSFDYPCFDEYMGGYIETIKKNREMKSILIEDDTFICPPRYAYERADRLGMFSGVMVRSVEPSQKCRPKRSDLRAIEKKLSKRVGELLDNKGGLYSVVGTAFPARVAEESDICRRIRAYGMMIQTEYWLERYRVVPI